LRLCPPHLIGRDTSLASLRRMRRRSQLKRNSVRLRWTYDQNGRYTLAVTYGAPRCLVLSTWWMSRIDDTGIGTAMVFYNGLMAVSTLSIAPPGLATLAWIRIPTVRTRANLFVLVAAFVTAARMR
jgi:hypothetical protein